MDDKNVELQSAGGGSDDALSRAERIKAIKNSIRKNQIPAEVQQEKEADTAPKADAVSKKETASKVDAVLEEKAAPKADDMKTESTVSEKADGDWENEIAARIARRVQKVKNSKDAPKKDTPESILKELDNIIASNVSALNNIGEGSAADNETPGPREEAVTPNAEDIVSEEFPEESAAAPAENIVSHEADAEKAAVEKTAAEKKKKPKKKRRKKSFKERILELLPQKADSIGERVRKIVFLGSVFAIIVFGVIIVDYYVDIYSTESDYNDIMNDYPSSVPSVSESESSDEYDGEYYSMIPGAEKLLEINKDVVGVIKIPNTEVNYPVLQSDDLEKYLDTSITGEKAKAGAIFLDYRNSFDKVDDMGRLLEKNSDNLIIYGHNMESGMMFGSLKNYRNNVNYYGEHPIIELNSNYCRYQYKIFAFFIVDAFDKTDTAFECWNTLNFNDETEFYNYVNEAKRRTLRLNDVDVEYGDKLLTLSTCNSIFGKDGGGRLIVMARLVRDGEDPYEGTQNSVANQNIKWPSIYYKSNKNEKYDPDAEFVPYGETAEETESDTEE